MTDVRQKANELIDEGNSYEDRGDFDTACQKYEQAAQLAPDLSRAWINLGIALAAKAEERQALDVFDRALLLDPKSPPTHYNRGLVLARLDEFDEAQQAFRAAVQFRPVFPDAYVALADVLEQQGCLLEAETALQTAIAQAPDHAGYRLNLGLVQTRLRKLDEAEATLRAALHGEPTSAPAAVALAAVLRDKCLHKEACTILEYVLAVHPLHIDALDNLLFTCLFRDDLTPTEIAERHRRAGELIESSVAPIGFPSPMRRVRGRRLRIGYVSGDFKRHAVANFILPVICHHDRKRFEVFCYSNTQHSDDVTALIRQEAVQWRDIRQLDDESASRLVINDGIDLLVDLSGHSGGNRLGIFSRKPAPAQLTWLGYLSTTGLTRIDYRVCDLYTDPLNMSQPLHTEELLPIPGSQWCFRPYIEPAQIFVPPVIKNGFPTFGSFNQFGKLSATSRTLWSSILSRLPSSKLVVMGVPAGECRRVFIEHFASNGIDSTRLELLDRLDLESYYQTMQRVDIALDTTPYSGATTTCDALWMGVPVVTLAGERPAARSGVSILSAVGLADLISQTADDYVATAVRLAKGSGLLSTLRHTLRAQMRRSSLMNESAFVWDLETRFQQVWDTWCESAEQHSAALNPSAGDAQ